MKTILSLFAALVLMAACTPDKSEIGQRCSTYTLVKDYYTLDTVLVKTISKKDYQACNDVDKLKFENMPVQWYRICDSIIHLEYWYYVKSGN